MTRSTLGQEEISFSHSSSAALTVDESGHHLSIHQNDKISCFSLSDGNGDGAWLQETSPAWLKEVVTCMHLDLMGV